MLRRCVCYVKPVHMGVVPIHSFQRNYTKSTGDIEKTCGENTMIEDRKPHIILSTSNY